MPHPEVQKFSLEAKLFNRFNRSAAEVMREQEIDLISEEPGTLLSLYLMQSGMRNIPGYLTSYSLTLTPAVLGVMYVPQAYAVATILGGFTPAILLPVVGMSLLKSAAKLPEKEFHKLLEKIDEKEKEQTGLFAQIIDNFQRNPRNAELIKNLRDLKAETQKGNLLDFILAEDDTNSRVTELDNSGGDDLSISGEAMKNFDPQTERVSENTTSTKRQYTIIQVSEVEPFKTRKNEGRSSPGSQ